MIPRSGLFRRATVITLVGAGLLVTAGTSLAAPNEPAGSSSMSSAVAVGTRSYLVITAPGGTAGVIAAITGNGGGVFATYDAIGVIVAHSAAADFATRMRSVPGVQQVGATRTSDVPVTADNPAIPPARPQATPTNSPEHSESGMVQIGADLAWSVNTGSPAVTVGVLDSGVDDQHFELRNNFAAAKSASCAYGRLDTRAGAWRAINNHGTHVAGTIAAARNGKGVIGVAPSVKIASVRVAEAPSGLYFPENTICAFVFAGDMGFDVTNSSYYTDPWMFACPDNLDQAAILEGIKRATQYAEGRGVLNIAAAGNENYNLAGKSTDTKSPNDSTPAARPVTNDCLSLPAELPGVVTVSSIDYFNEKSVFSNFGADKIALTAPGESVYSTLPGGTFDYMSGTSMAAPHVAGVAALHVSVNPNATVAELRTLLAAKADDLACSDSRCVGTAGRNNFYGEGRVDALAAVYDNPSPIIFESTTDVAIPDRGTARSNIAVSGRTGNAPAALRVDVNITHARRGDLVIDLVAPDGSAFRLQNAANDDAPNLVAAYMVNASNEIADGTWRLRVQDTARRNTGYINSWKLTF